MCRNVSVSVLFLAASAAYAGQPDIRNGKLNFQVDGGLTARSDRALHHGESVWLGYEVNAISGSRHSSCSGWGGDACCGVHYLDGNNHQQSSSQAGTETGTRILDIFLKFEAGKITAIRTLPPECHVDAGGEIVDWLTGVRSEESVALLAGIAGGGRETNKGHLADEALVALALHETRAATKTLTDLASISQPSHLREQAAFWLAVERGHDGFLALQKFARDDQDAHFREKLTFDLSQSSDAAATDELIRMAKTDANSTVRGQALFWLAQKAGKKEEAVLADATYQDPDTEVKKKAVFALSQMPREESILQLVHVAETNRDPAVRKAAIFWLGQSGDSRALDYLERKLKQ